MVEKGESLIFFSTFKDGAMPMQCSNIEEGVEVGRGSEKSFAPFRGSRIECMYVCIY